MIEPIGISSQREQRVSGFVGEASKAPEEGHMPWRLKVTRANSTR